MKVAIDHAEVEKLREQNAWYSKAYSRALAEWQACLRGSTVKELAREIEASIGQAAPDELELF